MRFHDLRHSCATNLLRAGVPMHVVQRILRHSSINTTSTIYAHLEVSDLEQGFEQLFGREIPHPDESPKRAVGGEIALPDESPKRGAQRKSGTNAAQTHENHEARPEPAVQNPVILEGKSRREWCRTTDLYRVKVALYR